MALGFGRGRENIQHKHLSMLGGGGETRPSGGEDDGASLDFCFQDQIRRHLVEYDPFNQKSACTLGTYVVQMWGLMW